MVGFDVVNSAVGQQTRLRSEPSPGAEFRLAIAEPPARRNARPASIAETYFAPGAGADRSKFVTLLIGSFASAAMTNACPPHSNERAGMAGLSGVYAMAALGYGIKLYKRSVAQSAVEDHNV